MSTELSAVPVEGTVEGAVEERRERLGTPVTEKGRATQPTHGSQRVNLKMRVTREVALWGLFAQDSTQDHSVSPFERARFQLTRWRDDRELWRSFFSAIKPKERIIGLWSKGAVWSQSEELICGVLRFKGAIDALIARSSHHWQLHRMGEIDRNLLRIATYELCFQPQTPARVVLNEAIELGKRYGSADSGRFINGVLDRVAQELGRVETRRAPKAPKVEVVSVRGAQGQREER
jgi:transcription antitermination factor NusB